MKRTALSVRVRLDTATSEMAVLGGAVLGGGGGGRLETGLRLGQLAAELGSAELLDLDSLPAQASLAAVAALSTSSTGDLSYRPLYHHRALELLQANTGTRIAGLVNCGSGAVSTLVGWAQAALLGVPLLDAVFDQGPHPWPALSLIECWPQQDTQLSLAVVGSQAGDGQRLEMFARGTPRQLARLLQQGACGERGEFAAALGPLPRRWACQRSSPRRVSQAIELGQAMMAASSGGATASAVGRALAGQVFARASVTDIRQCEDSGGASAVIRLRDEHNRPLELLFWHRYVALNAAGQQVAAFPDLIVAIGARGTPLGGAEMSKGQEVYIVVLPQQPRAISRELEEVISRSMATRPASEQRTAADYDAREVRATASKR